MTLSPGESEARLELLPTAPVEIELTAPRGREPPEALRVEVRPAPGQPSFPRARIECPREEETWRCEVPAGSVDLKIAAGGYVPVYLWEVALEPGRARAIDVGELRSGASVSGYVTASGGDPSGARVRLERHLVTPGFQGREAALAEEGAVNDRGFFLLGGVAAGEYVVTVDKEGHATTRSDPIRVDEGQETRLLTPLHLERPVTLEVFLLPPADPWGEPWEVEVRRNDPSARRAHAAVRGPVTGAGAWVRTGFEPGTYRLEVYDSRDSVVTERQVEVNASSPPVEVDIDIVPVEGRVLVGEEPVEGELVVSGVPGGRMRRFGRGFLVAGGGADAPGDGGRTSADHRRMRFQSDSEGRFEGYLPHEGFWNVEIRAQGGGRFRAPEPVEVREPEDGGPAVLEIAVPDTHLVGRVIDRSGRTVPGAGLMLADPGDGSVMARSEAGPDGEFSFRGLAEDPLLVQARARAGLSGAVEVRPRSGEETRVELVLERQIRVEGLVTGVTGPVPGAMVDLRPVGGGLPLWTTLGTGADGGFRHRVPAGASALDMVVVAPGYPLKLVRVPLAPENGRARVEVLVEAAAGVLQLKLGSGAALSTAQLAHGGARVEILTLLASLASRPGSVVEGGLAFRLSPGRYSVCAPPPECRQVFLSPGDTMEVDLGESEPREGGL